MVEKTWSGDEDTEDGAVSSWNVATIDGQSENLELKLNPFIERFELWETSNEKNQTHDSNFVQRPRESAV